MSEDKKELALEIMEGAKKLPKQGLANVASYIRGYADGRNDKSEEVVEDDGTAEKRD